MGEAGPRPLGFSGRAGAAAAGIVAAVLLLTLAPAAFAHDGPSRIVLEQDRVNPGGVLVVRGEDLGAGDPIRIGLVGGATQTELTADVSDGQGHLTVAVQIPADVPVGDYAIAAMAALVRGTRRPSGAAAGSEDLP